MIDISELKDHLKTIKTNDWQKLFDLIPDIENTITFGECAGMEKQDDGSYSFPYILKSEVVEKFIHVVYKLNIVADFEWSKWNEGILILNNEEQNYEQLDIITLCKLLTLIVRADRFNDGVLVGRFEDHTILKIILSMKNKITGKLLFGFGTEGAGAEVFLLPDERVVERGSSGGFLDEDEDPINSWEVEYDSWDEWWKQFIIANNEKWICFYPVFIHQDVKPFIEYCVNNYEWQEFSERKTIWLQCLSKGINR